MSEWAGAPGAGGKSYGPPGTAYEVGVSEGDGLVVVGYERDSSAPVIEITDRPKNRVKTSRKWVQVAVGFTSSEPRTTFECKLNRGAYAPCSSPHSIKVKAKRRLGLRHRLRIRATDAVGNVSAPVVAEFTAVRKG
jgi:hypothetical protein